MQKPIDLVRKEFNDLVTECGSDYKAADLLNELLDGNAPDRRTVGRIRAGDAKDTLTALATFALRTALNNKKTC